MQLKLSAYHTAELMAQFYVTCSQIYGKYELRCNCEAIKSKTHHGLAGEVQPNAVEAAGQMDTTLTFFAHLLLFVLSGNMSITFGLSLPTSYLNSPKHCAPIFKRAQTTDTCILSLVQGSWITSVLSVR